MSLLKPARVKKRVPEIVLQRVVHIIRSETLGETLGEREKPRQESCRESDQESRRDSLRNSRWDFFWDSWRDFLHSLSVSPESRIGLHAWLSARLSPWLVFLRGCAVVLSGGATGRILAQDGEIYRLDFLTEWKKWLTGGQRVLEGRENMVEKLCLSFLKIDNIKFHRQSADNYWLTLVFI